MFFILGTSFLIIPFIVCVNVGPSKSTPTSITAAKLANDGPPGDNWYLRLTDYVIIDPKAVCLNGSELEKVGTDLIVGDDRLEGFVFPKDGTAAKRTIKLYYLDVGGKDDVERFLARDSMDVLVRDPINLHKYSPADNTISLQVVDGPRSLTDMTAIQCLSIAFIICGFYCGRVAARIKVSNRQ